MAWNVNDILTLTIYMRCKNHDDISREFHIKQEIEVNHPPYVIYKNPGL